MSERHRLFSRRKALLPSASPGTLLRPDDARAPVVTVMAYDDKRLVEKTIQDTDEIPGLTRGFPVVWVNVAGLGDTDLLGRLGELFDLHPLALEDVLNTHHRPKAEDYDDNVFIVARIVAIRDNALILEQLSLFMGNGFVVSFEERSGPGLEPVRHRIRKAAHRARFLQTDYLAYSLVDAVIDGYFPVLEHFDLRLSDLENRIVAHPDRSVVERTHELKREFQLLRHAVWPMREALRRLSDHIPRITDDTRPFIRDCHDHVIQIVEILETYTERTAALTDLYLSSLSFKMNEIMKVLTIIATVFIPLSFIASLYGMNFNTGTSPYNMPELDWRFGYPFALALMGAVVAVLLAYFRYKGWIGRKRNDARRRD
ncbi:MAG: magnesium and cobalt transport protein CorA [Proteobacteria bacterium]|nr:MAG: magnesium and cobalt transport protein CorA [Pseudomonadota bacterium]